MVKTPPKYVSTALGFLFLVVGFTGALFQFFFKNHTLVLVHGWLGIGMLAVATIHVKNNWRPFINYFKDRRVLISAGLVAAIALGIALAPRDEKLNAKALARRLGEGRFSVVAAALGRDPGRVTEALRVAGLTVAEPDLTVRAVAELNGVTPERILSFF